MAGGSTIRLDGGPGHGQIYLESDFRDRIKAAQRMGHTEPNGVGWALGYTPAPGCASSCARTPSRLRCGSGWRHEQRRTSLRAAQDGAIRRSERPLAAHDTAGHPGVPGDLRSVCGQRVARSACSMTLVTRPGWVMRPR